MRDARDDQGALGEILALEEIEKVKPIDALLPLVSPMGSGYFSKLKARIGLRNVSANFLVWATCNDEDVLREWNRGVLWSRFASRWHCPCPPRR